MRDETDLIVHDTDEGQSASTGGLGVILYSYKGPAYNRPCSRGICVGKDMGALEDKLPEGDCYVEITVRGLAPNNESNRLAATNVTEGDM